jgi:hypothetical protein
MPTAAGCNRAHHPRGRTNPLGVKRRRSGTKLAPLSPNAVAGAVGDARDREALPVPAVAHHEPLDGGRRLGRARGRASQGMIAALSTLSGMPGSRERASRRRCSVVSTLPEAESRLRPGGGRDAGDTGAAERARSAGPGTGRQVCLLVRVAEVSPRGRGITTAPGAGSPREDLAHELVGDGLIGEVTDPRWYETARARRCHQPCLSAKMSRVRAQRSTALRRP